MACCDDSFHSFSCIIIHISGNSVIINPTTMTPEKTLGE